VLSGRLDSPDYGKVVLVSAPGWLFGESEPDVFLARVVDSRLNPAGWRTASKPIEWQT